MSTSTHEGLIRYPISAERDGMPIGPSITRDIVINNLLHAADEMAMPRACFWVSASIDCPESRADVGNWFKVASTGPFRLPLRYDGKGYDIRIKVAGAVSGSAGAVQFSVVAGPPSMTYPMNFTPNEDNVWQSGFFSGTSAQWISGSSKGSNASLTNLSISPAQASAWASLPGTQTQTLSDIGGTVASSLGCEIEVAVYVQTQNTTREPRLYGFYAAEYVGS